MRLLHKRGYTNDDIVRAIEYAAQHVKNFYGFGLVTYVIDDALQSVKAVNCETKMGSLLDQMQKGVVDKSPSASKPEWMKVNMEVV